MSSQYTRSRSLKRRLSRLIFLQEYASSRTETLHSGPSCDSEVDRAVRDGISMYFMEGGVQVCYLGSIVILIYTHISQGHHPKTFQHC